MNSHAKENVHNLKNVYLTVNYEVANGESLINTEK
jgi:hypothetical protein